MRGAGLRRRAAGRWAAAGSRFVAVVLALAAVGCAGPDKAPLFEQVAAREIAARPEWYTFGDSRAVLISRDGVTRGLIWGTLHVDYADDTLLPRPIRDRFAEAVSLSVEFDYDQMPRAERLAQQRRSAEFLVRPDPVALSRLDPRTRAALEAAGLPSDSTERYSLLGLSRLLAARAARDTSPPLMRSIGTVDGLLVRFARNRHIPVRSLEDPRHPYDVIYGGDPNGPEAARSLYFALRCGEDSRDFIRWARGVYARGRVAAMDAASKSFCTGPEDASLLARERARVYTIRNAVMAERIHATLTAQPGFHFVAVGAAHLLGTDGVPALLQARGWTVTSCPEDSC